MREVRAGAALVERAAELLFDMLGKRLDDQTRVSLALSGGRTPWAVFGQLAHAALDWSRVDIYQVDERVAPSGDAGRNLTELNEALLSRVPATPHPMPVEDWDLEAGARRYAARLPARLDIVHLGLGDDGHTASLIPGDPVLGVTDRHVAVTQRYRGYQRMTLTFPALNAAGRIVWIVSETGKAAALAKLRAGDPSIPAGRVAREHAVLLTDESEDG